MREKDRVTKAFDKVGPDLVALAISPEEVKGLKACVEGKVKEIALSNLEELFQERISAFGPVAVPSPFLAQAYILSKERGVKLKAVDIDETSFTEFYVKTVSTFDLIAHSQRVKKLRSLKFKARAARDFVIEWDRYLNRTTGIRMVEQQREVMIAVNLLNLPRKYARVLALVEAERYEGVCRNLEKVLGGR